MCGIVGVVSPDTKDKNCQTLLESLCKLEYRGYDSLGFSYINNEGDIFTKKSPERISDFISKVNYQSHTFSTAIAHTRWATHGGVNEQNSHPHFGQFASIVHNGIIENYKELKESLLNKGYKFLSQTDTEVIPHLISDIIKRQIGEDKFAKTSLDKLSQEQKTDLIKQVASVILSSIKGAFALAIVFKNIDGYILALKNRSPLVIGLGKNANFLASDPYAISSQTTQIADLSDNSYAIITSNKVMVFNKNSNAIIPSVQTITHTEFEASKGSFSTFMEKEIFEQPQTIKANLDHFLPSSLNNVIELGNVPFSLTSFSKISLIACGTSFYAAQLFCYQVSSVAKINAECEIASEFRYKDIIFDPNTLYIFISQSGETADTIAAIDFVLQNKHHSSKTIAVVNVKHSTIAKKCDGFVECLSGREIGVASTKNFTNQCISLLFVAIKIAQDKKEQINEQILTSIKSLPSAFYKFLSSTKNIETIKQMAKIVSSHKKVMFLGRSLLYPIALEGALKLKELSYIPTEGIASGELKHGPIAIVDENLACICLISKDILKEKTESSIQEVMSRKGKCLIISDYNFTEDGLTSFINISNNEESEFAKPLLPLLFIPFVQLLSFFVAQSLSLDVDKPRNLAKSVTVE